MEPIPGWYWWRNQFDSRLKVISSKGLSMMIRIWIRFRFWNEPNDQFTWPKFVNQTLLLEFVI